MIDRSKIERVLTKYQTQTFEYGVSDCYLFAADLIEAISGIDPAAEFRGRYKTRREGFRLLRKSGFKDASDWLDKNWDRLDRSSGRFGDLTILDGSCAFVFGTGCVALGKTGLIRTGFAGDVWRFSK